MAFPGTEFAYMPSRHPGRPLKSPGEGYFLTAHTGGPVFSEVFAPEGVKRAESAPAPKKCEVREAAVRRGDPGQNGAASCPAGPLPYPAGRSTRRCWRKSTST